MISVVVLNWNGAEDTLECLRSLRGSTVPLHVCVVDNGSSDDSVARIEQSALADELLRMDRNLGYAEGNNAGLERVMELGAETVVVLNNDTVVRPESIERLLAGLAEVPAAAVSPDIRYHDDPHSSWFRGGIVDRGWPRHLQADEQPAVSAGLLATPLLTGCCLGASAATWRRVGLFDPRYFLIFEDSDWSERARRSGVELRVVADSVIAHKVSRSFATAPTSLLGSYYFIRNGLRFDRSYYPGYLVAFLWREVLRPAPRLLRSDPRTLWFRICGALGFMLGQSGRAPAFLERWAVRAA